MKLKDSWSFWLQLASKTLSVSRMSNSAQKWCHVRPADCIFKEKLQHKCKTTQHILLQRCAHQHGMLKFYSISLFSNSRNLKHVTKLIVPLSPFILIPFKVWYTVFYFYNFDKNALKNCSAVFLSFLDNLNLFCLAFVSFHISFVGVCFLSLVWCSGIWIRLKSPVKIRHLNEHVFFLLWNFYGNNFICRVSKSTCCKKK